MEGSRRSHGTGVCCAGPNKRARRGSPARSGRSTAIVTQRKAEDNTKSAPWKRSERWRKGSCEGGREGEPCWTDGALLDRPVGQLVHLEELVLGQVGLRQRQGQGKAVEGQAKFKERQCLLGSCSTPPAPRAPEHTPSAPRGCVRAVGRGLEGWDLPAVAVQHGGRFVGQEVQQPAGAVPAAGGGLEGVAVDRNPRHGRDDRLGGAAVVMAGGDAAGPQKERGIGQGGSGGGEGEG